MNVVEHAKEFSQRTSNRKCKEECTHTQTQSGAVKYQEGISCAVFNTLNIAIPKDRRQISKTPNARQWLEAEKEEMDSMNIMQVYEPVKRSEVPN